MLNMTERANLLKSNETREEIIYMHDFRRKTLIPLEIFLTIFLRLSVTAFADNDRLQMP
jgi:hypothetical protein